ncbi:MAG: exosortase family protein XrtF [Nonlabens sp.]
MNSLKSYTPVFKFVGVFAGIYVILSLLYYGYKSQDWTGLNYPDPATSQVSYQTKELLQLLGYDASIYNSPGLPSVHLYIDGQVVFRVIEGCNAISVMILFLAFVLAFAKTWKKTLFFSLFGILVIYLINLFRLVMLAVIFVDYPDYAHSAHDLVFPAIIYGVTVLLWIFWIKKPKAV